jgi:hypothetical protein
VIRGLKLYCSGHILPESLGDLRVSRSSDDNKLVLVSYAEIADRLDHAKVAILVITPAFLRSKFCLHEEVPLLLQRARRGDLQHLPLFAEPCLRGNEPWLRRAQMWPTDGKAVSE